MHFVDSKSESVCSRYPHFCPTTQGTFFPCATKLIFLGTTLMFLEFLEPRLLSWNHIYVLGILGTMLNSWNHLYLYLFSWNFSYSLIPILKLFPLSYIIFSHIPYLIFSHIPYLNFLFSCISYSPIFYT
jgi:hypothetical protein